MQMKFKGSFWNGKLQKLFVKKRMKLFTYHVKFDNIWKSWLTEKTTIFIAVFFVNQSHENFVKTIQSSPVQNAIQIDIHAPSTKILIHNLQNSVWCVHKETENYFRNAFWSNQLNFPLKAKTNISFTRKQRGKFQCQTNCWVFIIKEIFLSILLFLQELF